MCGHVLHQLNSGFAWLVRRVHPGQSMSAVTVGRARAIITRFCTRTSDVCTQSVAHGERLRDLVLARRKEDGGVARVVVSRWVG
jgi:hypothetical protein